MFSDDLNRIFSALADPTRREILARLASGDATVNELAEPFAMSQPAVSNHIKVLERAGLVSRGREAQKRPCHLEVDPLVKASKWLESYRQLWEGRFNLLDTVLDEMNLKKKNKER
ncbi:MAG: metalloregulator ArsR/SmtB family transcription factor [Desulforhopalus sp.]